MLIAIDGSESSLHALRESFRLAEKEKSWITAVCVTPPYEGDLEMVGIGDIREAMSKPCAETMEKAKVIAGDSNKQVKFVHETGAFHERIIDVADELNCELIIMGRQGRNMLERTLIGSTASRVIGYSTRDVLIVPLKATIGWKNIVVATDGSRFSAQAVSRAIDFASAYGGKVNVISVLDIPAEFYGETHAIVDDITNKAKGYVDAAVNKAKEAGVAAEGFIKTGDSADVILDLAEEVKAETIVLGSHGRTGLRRLLLGSVAEKVIGLSSCPILVSK